MSETTAKRHQLSHGWTSGILLLFPIPPLLWLLFVSIRLLWWMETGLPAPLTFWQAFGP